MDKLTISLILAALLVAMLFVDFYEEQDLEVLYSNGNGKVKSIGLGYSHRSSEWTGIESIAKYIEEQYEEENVKILWLLVRRSRWKVRRMF